MLDPRLARIRRQLVETKPYLLPSHGRRAAVALILEPKAQSFQLLFIRRAEREGDRWSGHVAFPGGLREAGDTDIVETAVRETREEVGLRLDRDTLLLGRLDDLPAVASGRPTDIVITPLVFAAPRGLDIETNAEVAGFRWLSLEQLRDHASRSTHRVHYEATPHDLPALDVDGLHIWGLTYRILQALLTVILESA